MNFLFLNSASHGWGGNEKSIVLVAGILSANHRVVLAYRSEEIGRHADFTRYRLPFLFEGDLHTIMKLVSIVRKHRIDVIIASKRKDYAIGGIVSRLCGIRNIIWLGALRRLEPTAVNRLVYGRLADGFIVNASQIRQGLLDSGLVPAERIKVLYRGIDSRVLDRVLAAHPRTGGERMTVTAVGRLDSNKNHALLIRGFAQFLSMHPDSRARLLIMGEGDERPDLERLVSLLGIEEAVDLRGFVADPYPELATSDIFALTSRSEGISIALLEAMYLGNAPVSTPAGGGVTEIIENGRNGLIFDYDDEKALASIFLKLYLEPDYRKSIAEAAHRSVAERYSADRVERELVEFCQKTISSARP